MAEDSKYGIPGFEAKLTKAEIGQSIEEFENSLKEMAEHPPGNSQALIAFSEAAVTDLHDKGGFPAFREVVEDFMRDRPELVAPYKVQLFWRTFQYMLLDKDDRLHYPTEYDSPIIWQAAFRSILHDYPSRWHLQELLATRNNQTNEPRRYAGAKLAVTAFRHMLPDAPSLVDAGCSVGLGQVQLAANIPFKGVRINAAPADRKLIRSILFSQLTFSTIVGFDKVANTDTKWVEANSYYPSELTNTPENRARQAYRHFLYRERVKAKILVGDLVEGYDGVIDVIQYNNLKPYDAALAITTLYELPGEEVDQATATLESLTDKLVVVQDFAQINPRDPTKLIFAKDIYAPGSKYQLFAKPLKQRRAQWQQLGSWNSGRANVFTPSDYLIRLCRKADLRDS